MEEPLTTHCYTTLFALYESVVSHVNFMHVGDDSFVIVAALVQKGFKFGGGSIEAG